ncbi:MAG TPA: hypothetical protein VF622_12310 [Segetibacter sp.]|jgi:hypothetical protein
MRHSFGLLGPEKYISTMTQEKSVAKKDYGNEAPGAKDVLITITIFLLLTAMSWIAYYKFGWLH